MGVLGHSEGGLYAAMLAAEDPSIAFVVVMAAPAIDGVSLLVDQNEAILRAEGESEEEIAHAVESMSEALPLARDGDAEAVEETLRPYYGGIWDRLSDDERTIVGDREAFVEYQLEFQLRTVLSDWYRSILAYDPGPDWAEVEVPVLALYGANDVQVVLDPNEAALRAALESDGGTNLDLVVLPDANHLFQASKMGAISEYGTLAPEFTAEFLPTLVDWVTEQVGIAAQ
jgi:pimeloyl-ACP methyl ester carboxylesterase